MRSAEQLDQDRAAIMSLLDHPANQRPGSVETAQILALVYVGDAVRDVADSTYTAAQGAFGRGV